MACLQGSTFHLPADYIVSSHAWTVACQGAYEFSAILNRACAPYINSTSASVYSLFYDYPYSYRYAGMTCSGNYTTASLIDQDASCSASGSAGSNTIYALRNLTSAVVVGTLASASSFVLFLTLISACFLCRTCPSVCFAFSQSNVQAYIPTQRLPYNAADDAAFETTKLEAISATQQSAKRKTISAAQQPPKRAAQSSSYF